MFLPHILFLRANLFQRIVSQLHPRACLATYKYLYIIKKLVCPRTVAVGAAYYVDVFFSKLLVEKAGGEALVLSDGFSANWAGTFYSGLTGRVTVGTAHHNHQLVGNIHGTENFGNQVFTYKKVRLTDRALYRLDRTGTFGGCLRPGTISHNPVYQGNYYGCRCTHHQIIHSFIISHLQKKIENS